MLTDSSPERLCQYFCLLNLRAIHLRSNHGTERYFDTQFMRYGQGQCRFASSRSTNQQKGPSGELSRFYKIHNNTTRLSKDFKCCVHEKHLLEHVPHAH